jgi:hypothetical protein
VPRWNTLIKEQLHRRISALEDALRQATSDGHPLLADVGQIIPGEGVTGSESTSEVTVGDRDVLGAGATTRNANEAVDRLSSCSHLVVGDQPGRSRYYGAASSAYLKVSALWTRVMGVPSLLHCFSVTKRRPKVRSRDRCDPTYANNTATLETFCRGL